MTKRVLLFLYRWSWILSKRDGDTSYLVARALAELYIPGLRVWYGSMYAPGRRRWRFAACS